MNAELKGFGQADLARRLSLVKRQKDRLDLAGRE